MTVPLVAPPSAWVAVLERQQLGRYILNHCVGDGHFSHVFHATEVATGDIFAVKVLAPGSNPEDAADFANEGALLAKLSVADGVVNYFGTHVDQIQLQSGPISVPLDVHYHVLSMASRSLSGLLDDPVTRATIPWIVRLEIWRDLVKGIGQMHRANIAHRDLKAANCLLFERAGRVNAKLADLGRGKDMTLDPSWPLRSYLKGRGDLRFAPPEFLYMQGGADYADFIAADYYGLASLLTELASGHPLSILALMDIGVVMRQSAIDFTAGVRRDLAGLAPRYRNAVADVAALFPQSIRADADVLLNRLGHPSPPERLKRPNFRKDRYSSDPLDWVIRRIDIMVKRLRIAERDERARAARDGAS